MSEIKVENSSDGWKVVLIFACLIAGIACIGLFGALGKYPIGAEAEARARLIDEVAVRATEIELTIMQTQAAYDLEQKKQHDIQQAIVNARWEKTIYNFIAAALFLMIIAGVMLLGYLIITISKTKNIPAYAQLTPTITIIQTGTAIVAVDNETNATWDIEKGRDPDPEKAYISLQATNAQLYASETAVITPQIEDGDER